MLAYFGKLNLICVRLLAHLTANALVAFLKGLLL